VADSRLQKRNGTVRALQELVLPLLIIVSVDVQALCVTGASAEPSLQSVFDSVLPAGTIDVATDCLDDAEDSFWQQDGGTATTTIVVEIAGFAPRNVFGIFDSGDATNVVSVFDGVEGSGDSSEIEFSATDDGRYDVSIDQTPRASFTSDQFGFFLRTPQGNSFYSDTSLNEDRTDHMYAYLGNASAVPFATSSVLSGRYFSDSFFLLAFEDLDARNRSYDGDFQDFVVGGEFVAPIPLPASLVLLISSLGLMRLSGLRASRRSKS